MFIRLVIFNWSVSILLLIAGCNVTKEQDTLKREQENLEVIERTLAAFIEGDLKTLFAAMSEDRLPGARARHSHAVGQAV